MSDALSQAQAVLKETSDRLAAEAAERQRELAAALAEATGLFGLAIAFLILFVF
jgi:hypothetical protein